MPELTATLDSFRLTGSPSSIFYSCNAMVDCLSISVLTLPLTVLLSASSRIFFSSSCCAKIAGSGGGGLNQFARSILIFFVGVYKLLSWGRVVGSSVWVIILICLTVSLSFPMNENFFFGSSHGATIKTYF